MTEERKQIWFAYLTSLAIAFGIGIFFIPLLRTVTPAAPAGVPTRALTYSQVIEMVAISGFVFGTAFFFLGMVRIYIRIPSFGLNLIIQTLLIGLTVSTASVLVGWTAIFSISKSSPFDPDVLAILKGTFWTGQMALFLAFGVFLAFLINSVFQISRKLGPGVLWNWMTGKYYHPREEERIFMFLDIRDSTSLGERLGNLKFSECVRDFFRDITIPVLETQGQVSHFIGDEVVLTWKPEAGLKKANCIACFYKIRSKLEANQAQYLAKFGLVPTFKAGLHIGKVIATEVGEIKSEIVFHGDVLNTAARLQSLCNEEGCDLLVSGDLASRLPPDIGYEVSSCGKRLLKGKEQEVEVLRITPSEDARLNFDS